MQRRELLEKLISAAVAAGLLGSWSAAAAHTHACERDAADDLESFRWQMQRWARNDSSEQSVPMFLALENLADNPGQKTFVPRPENQALVEQFERLVKLLLQYKPEATESDIAALLVLMAEQELVPLAARTCA